MDNKKDPMEQIIVEDFLDEAQDIDAELDKADVEMMPENIKEKIKQRLHEQIDEYEKENVYAQLSEEDRKALELGREMLKNSESGKDTEKVVRLRKRKKVYVAVAAVAVLVLAMGITSIGGAERVVELIKVMIGDREIVRVETDEDNYISTNEDEEKSYQEIKDVFGVEPVKLIHWPDGTVFVTSEIDENLQTAHLLYDCKGKIIQYSISSHYTDSSWGIDVEDEITDQYYIQNDEIRITIKEYELKEAKIKSYSASYTYKGLEYFLSGVMEKEEFDLLIKNLNFL